MTKSRTTGFTLIELLIVVVIIGILAAIAIPKFSSTKGQAFLAAMRSDLRNLATAEESYYYSNNAYSSNLGRLVRLGYTLCPGRREVHGIFRDRYRGRTLHARGSNHLQLIHEWSRLSELRIHRS
jgi:prepilin-type N-terminal cleavage/methylation domain-containing protein